MAELNTCPNFWTEEPAVLFRDMNEFFPFSEEAKTCSTVALNSLTRFSIYLGLLLCLVTHSNIYLGIPVLGCILSVALYYNMKKQGTLRKGATPTMGPPFAEGFTSTGFTPNIAGPSAANKFIEDIIGVKERTKPTAENPFMNLLINEIAEYPKKPPAKYTADSDVKKTIDDSFETSIYGDPGDVWNRNQSQREFYTMPSTSVPNDRESFQNWLYRIPGKTCKEGNTAACIPGTDGSPVTFLGGR
jgi:hypothetical protein